MSSHPLRRSVINEDDGRWATHPDVDKISSEPRDRRSWCEEHASQQVGDNHGEQDELRERERAGSGFTYDLWRKERVERDTRRSWNGIRWARQTQHQALTDTAEGLQTPYSGIKDESDETQSHQSITQIPLFVAQEESAETVEHREEIPCRDGNNLSQSGQEPSDIGLAIRPRQTTIPQGCKCPISLQCEAKDNKLIDCRTLVVEWTKWKKRQEDDSRPKPPIDVPLESEPFATTEEVELIIGLLDAVQHRQRLSMGLRVTFGRIQDWIRRMQCNSVTPSALQETQVVKRLEEFLSEEKTELRRSRDVPQHMVEDLTIIQKKWAFGDLSVLARRGLRQTQQDGHLTANPDWKWARSADYFGHGHLTNGQTWHYRAEMCRDGAHGPPVAGIAGTVRDGARSIVMGLHDTVNNEYYADVDQGDIIWYMGTALKREEDDTEPTNLKEPGDPHYRRQRVTKGSKGQGPTNSTKALITARRTGNPVRVFRSFRLAEIVPLHPDRGFRYDGLYVVTDLKLLEKERQIYRFKLERLTTGQGPIRENLAPPVPESRKRKRTSI
ncbi:hypothetical protein A1O3_02894 [Capronia epimyces CBS 606.96]|uniref:YDG domain-containing protein n=1 Tax=Capronia epimyces CBS 606.96 TaxID=1182542 RepID=W9YAG9_9EURO|nr:uncharacterized protein A1O3_02894 [Capronia epimyces CBS 606.96]EXJ89827.1 hypothetical protein A1O3_02894 [Capronia epimyces CBS 606.96]